MTDAIIERVTSAVWSRLRTKVKQHDARCLAADLGIEQGCGSDYEILCTLAAVRAHMSQKIDLIVDVGAYKGDFLLRTMEVLCVHDAICFEPNEKLHDGLRDKFANHNVEIRCKALSVSESRSTFYVHDDMSMSSLLATDRDEWVKNFATYDIELGEEVFVEVSTLDKEVALGYENRRSIFLKIDTQGNELDVLKGGAQLLKRTTGVLVESMFTKPYRQQTTFEELHGFLHTAGFKCAAVVNLKRKSTNRISAVDFLYLS